MEPYTSKDFTGPWYTLKEAAQKTDLLVSEVIYRIEYGHITPVLYCEQPRRFLFVTLDHEGNAYGNAHFYYRGMLRITESGIHRLLMANNTVNLSGVLMQPLQPQFIDQWCTQYPYKCDTPNKIVIVWQGCRLQSVMLNRLTSIPFPEERGSFGDLMTDIFGTFASTNNNAYAQELLATAQQDTTVNFDANKYAVFTPDDLRIPASAIARLQTPIEPSLNTVDLHNNQLVLLPLNVDMDSINDAELEPKSKQPEPPADVLPVSLISELTDIQEVLARLIAAHPEVASKVLWRYLQEDYQRDEPVYDPHGVIMAMDSTSIEWQDRRQGQDKSLAYRSFASALSKTRRKMAVNP